MKKLIFAILFVFVGCLSSPDIPPSDVCSYFLWCSYYNQKNPDKSACVDFAKECRAKKRYEYCKKKENQTSNFTNCMLNLNQK